MQSEAVQREAQTVTNLWTTKHVAGSANKTFSRVRIESIYFICELFLDIGGIEVIEGAKNIKLGYI